MKWEIVIWSLNLSQGHDSIILGVGVLNCYCFGVLHSHYVWFLCCLSLNCAFDANQIGNFHLLHRRDGPPLIAVPPVVAQPVLVKLQNCIFNAVVLTVIWWCIQMKHTANKNSKTQLQVQLVVCESSLLHTQRWLTLGSLNCSTTLIWASTVKKIRDIIELWTSVKSGFIKLSS